MSAGTDLREEAERRKVRRRVRVRTTRSRQRRRRSRRIRIALLIVASLVVLALLAVIPALGTRARLEEARGEMEAGLSALLAGRAAAAQERFFAAEDAFIRARGQAQNPLMRAAGLLPVLGRTPDAILDVAQAGSLLAQSGKVVSAALAELPDQALTLAPDRGRIRLRPLRQVAPALQDAQGLVARAEVVMDDSPANGLLGPVASASAELEAELDRARSALTSAAAVSRALPTYLGGDGSRKYFVAAQNPAELRGTGGLIGAYAILTARNGRIELSDFSPIQDLQSVPPDRVEPPNPDFAARYERYGGAGFWSNINMTADFPSAAVAIERLYEEVTGTALDGVIAADPFTLEALVEATGEVEVPAVGEVVDAETVVPFITNEAYALFPDSRARKRLLGDVASAVFDRFLAGGFEDGPAAAARAVIGAAADGHLLLHSVEEGEQRAFREAGISGQLGPASGDYLAVIANNAAGNKADFYARRTVRYQVRLGAEGTAIGNLFVDLANGAPQSGPPRYVIGPHPATDLHAGDNLTLLSAYCAPSCFLEAYRRDGRPEGVIREKELAHPVFSTGVELRSGASTSLQYTWALSRAWEGNDGEGRYRLAFHGQPTVKPTILELDIRVPDGMRITAAMPGMQVQGGRAVWRGETRGDLSFELSFERPLLERMWRGLVRFFQQPVVHVD